VSKDLITGVEINPSVVRGLNYETRQKFGVGSARHFGNDVTVFPYHSSVGELVAQKIRTADKKFQTVGDWSKIGLWGQHMWAGGGRRIVITEGEIDAMSVSQVQDNKWPVVSVPNGAHSAKEALAKHIEWLESFEEVVICFDMDEPGKEAARACAELLTPGKAKIVELPLKDANEMLKADKGDDLRTCLWNAATYRPDGIVCGEDLWKRLTEVPEADHIEYPFSGLNQLLIGARRGQIVTFCAGTGIGKSELVNFISHHWMGKGEVIGQISLEETVEETSFRYMSFEAKKRLLLDRTGVSPEQLKKWYDATVGSGRLRLYDHWGSLACDTLFARIKQMVVYYGCTTIILDHLSIVVSGIEDGDERRLIDNIMTRIASLVSELKCRFIVISHLRKPDGTPHEEGGRVTLDDLRGSAAIKQLSYDIIGMERNQQDPKQANKVHLRVLKCRRTGKTGSAGWLEYNSETAQFREVDNYFDDEPAPTPQKGKRK
jgi:twinkle protein